MNAQRALFAVLTLLITAMACVVPGLPIASQTEPTADTRLEIMVAETVSAALQQTQQAVPAPTMARVSTSTPQPTTIPPSPTPDMDDSGSAINRLEDNSAQFIDMKVGYEIIIPVGWLPIRINSQEYLDAWLLPELSNPAMQRSLGSIERMNPDEVRLFVLDIQEGHTEIDFVTNINFFWDQNNNISFENDEDLKAIAAALPESFFGLEVTAAELSATATGIPAGLITSKTMITTPDGVKVEMFQKQVFVNSKIGMLIITLSTTEELKQAILPQFDGIIAALKVSNQ